MCPRAVADAETMFWDKLQSDWDNFEATATGVAPASRYQFQANNPYLLGDSSRTTQHHLMHTGGQGRQSVMEVSHRVNSLPRIRSGY
ncbi:hypothetical protein NLJ89_g12181 [Agrocybe chaxingu]|uniref:Uncharacterized protein n=1 Tax=Agrocybe chaxingu TaxID=84603 RepID=A0A9W8JMC2_9AGAR|nr:hypothetical protein NLJ89_g12181 [Agrocybe chaxingu]